MADSIMNLWPEQFKVDVQTPYAILQTQAGLLGKVTRGILEAVVETETTEKKVQHRLVVIAPAYNSYRHTLLVARHDRDLPYPAEVQGEALAKTVRHELIPGSVSTVKAETVYPTASSDEQMVSLVREALQSEETRAVILSLIAKSNEGNSVPP